MFARLPPLTALRAFDAAARHMSFARAADELHVTPAALSFQIKSLEEQLGQPVFHRLNRAVELTEIGALLAPGIQEGFTQISGAWSRARRFADQSILTITAGPAFTSLWLAPRLFSFAEAHPEIELKFSASLRLVDFDRDDVDLAIRFGRGPDEGLFSQVLAEEWLTPMATPELAARLQHPEDLREMTLLHDDPKFIQPPVDWATWFQAAGISMPDMHGAHFNQADHTVGAALAGVGVILGRISLTEGALRDGRLVMPFPLTLKSGANYRLVCPKGTETRPQVAAFIDWMGGEAHGLRSFSDDRLFVSPV